VALGNSQSTAGPATWTTFPIRFASVVAIMSLFRGRRAAYHSMISLVMLAWRTRFINNVSLSIMSARSTWPLHGGHARGMFGGGRFQQRAVEFHLHALGQQRLQYFRRRLLQNKITGSDCSGISSGSTRASVSFCDTTLLNSL